MTGILLLNIRENYSKEYNLYWKQGMGISGLAPGMEHLKRKEIPGHIIRKMRA